MSGGQQINSGQGTVIGGPSGILAGAEAGSGAGSSVGASAVGLKSRKVGSGTASAALVGQVFNALASVPGGLIGGPGAVLVGQQSASATGTFTKLRTKAAAGSSAVAITGSVSPPPSVGGTALQTRATNMAVGWAQFTSATGQDAVLGSQIGATQSMTNDCFNMSWNPVGKRIEVMGQDHGNGADGSPTHGMRQARYDAQTDGWTGGAQGVPWTQTETPAADFDGGHGADHSLVNPFTGDLYYRVYGPSGSSSSAKYYKKPYGGGNGSVVAVAWVPPGLFEVFEGHCWWTGTFTGGVGGGVQGCLVYFNSGDSNIFGGSATDGRIHCYNPLTNSWFFTANGALPFGGQFAQGTGLYNSMAVYSPIYNCAVYGGANAFQKRLWRMNSNGTFSAMPDTPSGAAGCGMRSGNMWCDPASGKFILMSNGSLWELDPTGAGAWSGPLTGAHVPPAAFAGLGTIDTQGIFSVEIPEYNVTAVIQQKGSAGGTFWLYKRAASSPPPPPPPPPPDDWATRSAGAVVANRLETQATRDAWVFINGTQNLVSVDTSVKVAGALGSIKFSCLNTTNTDDGSIVVPLGRTFVQGQTIWFSFRVRAPIEWVYAPWTTGNTGAKFSILSTDQANGGSNQVNEIVTTLPFAFNEFQGYNQDGSGFAGVDLPAVTNCSATDFRLQGSIDRGANTLSGTNPDTGAAWTPCEQDRRRYSTIYSARSNAAVRPGVGDPLSGGLKMRPDVFYTITCRVVEGAPGVANTRWTEWVAPDGQGYTKTFDKTDVKLGNGPAHRDIWLLPYVTGRSAGGRQVSAVGGSVGGITIPTCGVGTALGDGTLEYTTSTQRFRFKASNDNYGTARGFSVANGITVITLSSSADGVQTTLNNAGGLSITLPQASIVVTDASSLPASGTVVVGTTDTSQAGTSHGFGEQRVQYTGKAGNTLTGCSGGIGTHDSGSSVKVASFIVLRVDSVAALPSSGVTTMAVTIADGRKDTAIYYNDVIVKDNSPISASGGFVPDEYTTTFPLTENPISEGGLWHSNAAGWTRVRTTPGFAFGTQIDNAYDDSYAYIPGFGNNYEIEGTIWVSPTITGGTHEVELLLRVTDGNSPAPFVKLFEMDCLQNGQVLPMRWNGAIGDFTPMSGFTGSGTFGRSLQTGDVVKARIIGSQITVWANGVQILSGSDGSYPTGDPGIGMFFRVPDGGNVADLRFTRVTVRPL